MIVVVTWDAEVAARLWDLDGERDDLLLVGDGAGLPVLAHGGHLDRGGVGGRRQLVLLLVALAVRVHGVFRHKLRRDGLGDLGDLGRRRAIVLLLDLGLGALRLDVGLRLALGLLLLLPLPLTALGRQRRPEPLQQTPPPSTATSPTATVVVVMPPPPPPVRLLPVVVVAVAVPAATPLSRTNSRVLQATKGLWLSAHRL